MRKLFVLNSPLKPRTIKTKRWLVNGKRPDSSYAKNLLEKYGEKVEEIIEETNPPANEFKGIPIGYLFGGLGIWAKNLEQTHSLFLELCKEDLIKSSCDKMPVGKGDNWGFQGKKALNDSQQGTKHQKVENSNADKRERINNRKHRQSVSRHKDCPRPADALKTNNLKVINNQVDEDNNSHKRSVYADKPDTPRGKERK